MTGLRVACLLVMLLGCTSRAHAETNELDAKLFFASEFDGLYHPQAVQSAGAWTLIPRVGLRASYGVNNWLDLGTGLEFAVPSRVSAHVLQFQDVAGGRLVAEYYDFIVPITVMFRSERGEDVSFWASLSGGLLASHWSDLYMHSELPNARPVALPIDVTSAWHGDAFARAEVGMAWRPNDWFALAVIPYVTRAWQGSTYVGLGITADFLMGVGKRG